ncbi:hypothetical protein A5622_11820 [Mycobacterium sp. 1245801.1]|nr:hypothetical protein A5622_11820 [Mycobacterium sp. 1245801.1]
MQVGDLLAPAGLLVHKVEHEPDEQWQRKGGRGRNAVFLTFGPPPLFRMWFGEYDTPVEVLDGSAGQPARPDARDRDGHAP